MQKRKLGRSGLEIAPLVFGGNVFGWTADEARSFDLLDRFVAQGFNAIDTADVYAAWAPGLSGGESENMLGRWLSRRGRREDVVLMTKVGLWEPRKGLAPDNIVAAVDASLQRLQTDYIDLYFAHVDDESVPLEDTLGAFSELIAAGKVRAIGASNYSAGRLQQALTVSHDNTLPRYEVIQPEYNLYDRAGFEAELAGIATQHELGVVSYFSLASGFLSGKYRSLADVEGVARADFLQRYFDARGLAVLDTLQEVAAELSLTPAQVALAWLMQRPGVSAPIASATTFAQLDELMAAAQVALPAAAVARLDALG